MVRSTVDRRLFACYFNSTILTVLAAVEFGGIRMHWSTVKSFHLIVRGAVVSAVLGLALLLGGSLAFAVPMGVWVHQRAFPNYFACSDSGKYDVAQGNAARYDCRTAGTGDAFHYELWEFIN